MTVNFDKIYDRSSTFATKTYVPEVILNKKNAIPLWVADMDFEVCPAVTSALLERLQQPIFGYTEKRIEAKEAVVNWMNRRHQLKLDVDDVTMTTGVIPGYSTAIRLLTDIGDELVVCTPAYGPFIKKIEANQRKALCCPLKSKEVGYSFDYDQLEKLISEKTKVFVLCNPHNPTGKLYTHDELEELAKFCEKHNLKIISDEIHGDICWGHFVSMLMINEYTQQNTIVLSSSGKTFNLAGMKIGFSLIKNPQLREQFFLESERVGNTSVNCLAQVAHIAAYQQGDQWLDDCLSYIRNNMEYAARQLNQAFPQLKVIIPDATYFIWVDLSEFHLSDDVVSYLLEKANIYVTPGSFFGPEYQQMIRLNMATQFSRVKTGIDALIQTLMIRD